MVPSKRGRSGNDTGSDRFLLASVARVAGFVFASAATVRLTALLAALSCIWLQPAAAQMPQAPEIAVSGNGVDITNGASRPSATNHTNFGDAALLDESGENGVVERTFTISNGGTGTLTLGANAVSLVYRPGARRGGWRVKTQPAETVAAGGTTTFTIVFDPASATTQSVFISIASDDADEDPFRFRVGGRGVTARMGLTWAGENLIPTGTVDFGALEVAGEATQQVVTVANTGRYALALGDNAVSIEGDADFTVVTQPAATVEPGETTTFTLAFAAAVPGERTATATLAVANDLLRRPGVEISLEGDGAVPEITVAAGTSPVTEGTAAEFTLTRTRSVTEPLTVGVTVSETGDMLAAAEEGQKSVTFAAGADTATLTVATVADTADEADSVVTVTVAADTADPITYKPGTPAAASVTVNDIKLPEITVTADAASVTEGTAASFTLTRMRSMTAALTVGVTVSEDGHVLAATEEGQRSVMFAAGSATATLSLPTQADSADEDDSTVTVTVGADSANPPTYKPGSPAAASVTVNDDDANQFTIRFTQASYSATENGGNLSAFIRFRSASGRPPAGAVSVNIATRAGSALAGQDFTTHMQTLSVSPSGFFGIGTSTHRISVRLLDDGDYEGPETFELVLSSPDATDSSDSAILGTPATATATIVDNDRPEITVTADTASVTEGTAGAFTLRRTGILTAALTVGVTVSEDGDVLAATDEGQKSVTFQADEATATLTLPTQADSADEADSTVTVTVAADSMSPATYVRGSPAAASVTVIDDDVNRFTISFAEESYSVAENGGQLQVQVAFASSSNRPPAGDLSVTVRTRDGSAQGAQDFAAQTATLTVRPGVHFDASGRATATLFIPIHDDSASEPAETFLVDLSLPEATDSSDSASLGTPASTTVTITDNELPGITVEADAASVTEGTAAVFTLTRTRIVTDTLTVAVTVSEDGDVLAAADEGQKSVTFAAGALTAELSLPTVDDAADEADSVVTVTVDPDTASTATYALGTPAAATVTVNDNEVPAVTVAADAASVTEGTAAVFILTRTGILTAELTVGVTVSEDGDVLAATEEGRKSVIFQANEATATLSLTTEDDAAMEADSVVTVTVNADTADPANYEPGTMATATVTVNDNEVPAITVAAGTSPVTEGTAAEFTLTRTGLLTEPLTVGVTVTETGGDMLAAADEGQRSVMFADGSATATLTVATEDDAADEADSVVTVTVNADTADPITYEPGTTATATVTVSDNDLPAVTIAAGTSPVTEGTTATFTLNRTGSTAAALTVGVTVSEDGDVLATTDEGQKSVTFAADSATATLRVSTHNDTVSEAHSVVTVEVVANPATYEIGTPATASVTVNNDDVNAFTIAFAQTSYSVDEDAGPLTIGIVFQSAIGQPPVGPVSVFLSTRGRGTAGFTAQSLADYGTQFMTVDVQPGDFDASGRATLEVSVPIHDDSDYEGAETFRLDLSSPGATHSSDGASLGTPFQVIVTIADDDLPAVTVAAGAASVTEGTAASFTLTRTRSTTAALTVGVTVTESGAMLSGTAPTSVTFAAGSDMATLSLATADDAVEEADSVVTVTVDADTASTATYVPGTTATATVTVSDNDLPAVTVAADAASVTEGTAAAFTLTRAGILTAELTVGVTVSEDGDVLAAADEGQKSVTFAANSATAALSVTTQDDAAMEADSVVTVTVDADTTSPATYEPGTTATATVTVNDNDGAPSVPAITIAAGTSPVTEGTAASFTLTRTGSTTAALEVDVTVSESRGNSEFENDGVLAPSEQGARTVTFAAGSPTAALSVATHGDTADEADSVVTVTVVADTTSPATYEPGTTAAASVTVSDDDGPLELTWSVIPETPFVDEGATAHVTIRLAADKRPTEHVSFRIFQMPGTAKAGSDFEVIAPRLIQVDASDFTAVPGGGGYVHEFVYEVEIVDDEIAELGESFTIELGLVTAFNEGHAVAGTAGTITIRTSDQLVPVISITAGTSPVTEGTTATFTLNRTGSTTAALTVGVTVSETGDVLAAADEGQKSVTFAASSATATLTLATDDDAVDEADSVVTVTVNADTTDPIAYAPGTPASVTVNDDELTAITVAADAASVTEGTAAAFTLTRVGATDAALEVGVTVSESRGNSEFENDGVLAPSEQGARTVRFAAGSSTAALSVATQGDTADEADSVVTVTLVADSASPATYEPGTTATASVTVSDDDDPLALTWSVLPETQFVEEGATAQVTIRLAADRLPTEHVSFRIFPAEQDTVSAEAGSDFEVIAPRLTQVDASKFTAAMGGGYVHEFVYEVVIVDDEIAEGDESFTIKLGLVTAFNEGHTVAGTEGTITIRTSDQPVITIAAGTSPVTEGTAAAFTLTRTGSTTAPLTVGVTVSETGSMLSGTAPTSVTFGAGSPTATLSLATDDDAADETDSVVTVTVDADTGDPITYEPGTPATASVTVNDDDGAPSLPAITIAAGTSPVTEGTAAAFTLTRTGSTTAALTVGVTVAETGDVLAAADEGQKSVMFAAGSDMATLSVTTQNDAADEADSAVTVTVVANPATYALGTPATATVTVNDNDLPAVTIAAGTSPVTEGTDAAFTLTRTGVMTAALTVGVTVSEDGDVLAATDEGQKSVTFAANSATAALSVTTQNDTVSEAHSAVTVTVNADTAATATYAVGTPAAATVTVDNDDVNAFTIAFAQSSYSVAEDAGSLTIGIVFESALGQAPVGPVSVFLSTRGLGTAAFTAQSIVDYGTLFMSVGVQPGDFDASGRATLEVSVPIVNDSNYEGAETFRLDLSSPDATHSSDSASLGTPIQTIVTIADDDLPVITVAAGTSPVTEGTAAAFTLTRTRSTTAALTVGVTVTESGAMLSGTRPTSVTFAAGSDMATLSLATADDAVEEADSVVTVTVDADTADPATYEPGTTATATVTVNDNDGAPSVPAVTIAAGTSPVTEGTAASFTLTRTGVMTAALTVGVTVSETGSMLSGTAPTSVTFAASSATATLSLPTEADTADEADSVVTVTVDADTASTATYEPGTPATATVTVSDDDGPLELTWSVLPATLFVEEGATAQVTIRLAVDRLPTDHVSFRIFQVDREPGMALTPETAEAGSDFEVITPRLIQVDASDFTAAMGGGYVHEFVYEFEIVDDEIAEGNESFTIKLGLVTAFNEGHAVTGNIGTVTIRTSDQPLPAITIAAGTSPVTEGTAAAFTLNRTGNVTGTLTVGVTVSETGDVLAAADEGQKSVTFAANSATAALSVATQGDTADEAASVVTVTVNADTASTATYEPGTTATATVTVNDDDVPSITVAADAPSVTEGTPAAFTLTRAGVVTDALTVTVAVSETGDMLAGTAPDSVTFAAGAATAALSLATEDDAADEADSVVTVTVNADTTSPATYEPGTTATATVTVNDDDVPSITVMADRAFVPEDSTVAEGELAAFILTRTGIVTGTLTVVVTVSESGDVLAAADEGQKSVIFQAGSPTATLSLATDDDMADEADSVVTVTVNADTASPATYEPGTPAASVTVTDDDLPAVTVAADAPSVTEGTAAAFTLTRAGIVTAALTVGVTVSEDGAMLSGTAPTSVTFAANSATAALSLPTEDDAVEEAHSAVTVTVNADTTNPATYVPGTPAAATVTVNDNEVLSITIAADAASVTEGTAASFTLTRTRIVTDTLTVAVTVSEDGDVLAAADEGQKSVTFQAGSLTAALSLPTVDDAADEADSVVTVTVNADTAVSPTYLLGTPAAATVTVTDNELPAITVAADTASVTEGTAASFTLTRTGLLTAALTAGVTVSESGDVLAAADEGQKSVTFQIGSATATLSLATEDDAATEAHSAVTVTVDADSADPATYEPGTPAAATVTVNDNDLPAITIAADAASVAEGTAVAFTLTRTGNLAAELTVLVSVAMTGDMVTGAPPSSVTFQAGSATATLSLATEDDAADEADSVVTVTIVADSNDPITYAPGAPAAATVTVTDNDAPMPEEGMTPGTSTMTQVGIAPGASPVTEGEPTAFTLTRTGPTDAALQVVVAVSESGDVLAPTDEGRQGVTFQAGSATATLSLPTEDDAVDEADSVVTVRVVADSADPATYLRGTPATASVTVNDNDLPAVTVAADAASVTEGTAASFTLTRTGVVAEALTVGVTVLEEGDMLAGALPSSVTFAGSSATATLSLATEDDTADEANSVVTVTVVADSADPITYAPGTPATATVTVTDNDVTDIGMAQRISGAREWLVRFGRTVTALVSETLGSRLSEQGPKGDRLTIAGRAVPIPASDGSATPAIAAAFDDASRDRADDHGSAGEVPLDTLLSASGFAFSQGNENGSGWSIWGQGSGGRFSGAEGSLSLSGEVVSAAAGLEYAGLDSLGGIAVIHGRGGGRYEHRLLQRPASKYEIVAHMTGVHPYVRISPDERTNFWGTIGFSRGSMSVKDPRGSYDSDIEMLMGAVGASRQLLRDGGFDLKLRGDAFGSHLGSKSAPGLLAVEGDVFRIRAGAEAGHELAIGDGTTLRPSIEAGLRYDGGDAERGAGLELGGGLEFRDPARGVSVEAGGRLLVMHSDSDYRDWSVSGSFSLDPDADGRGLFLSLRPSYDTGSAEPGGQLMLEQSFAGIENERKPSGKVRFEMGYGLGAFGTGVLTPHAGVEVDDAGTRRYGTGVRLRLGGNLSLGVTSRHRFEGGNDHALQLRGSVRW